MGLGKFPQTHKEREDSRGDAEGGRMEMLTRGKSEILKLLRVLCDSVRGKMRRAEGSRGGKDGKIS
jgi:hypothetical protein